MKRGILWCILLLGALVRCHAFPDIPPGLNQDEASSGYEAWALLHYGVDRHGFRYPVQLVSWGSGQNALYSYLAMPFIAMLGLNALGVRSLSLVFGLITLPVFHRFSRAASDANTALWATFLLAVSPWHIMLCRWALESNLFPGIFLIGAWLLLRAIESPRLLPLSFACFSLSQYAYGSAYLVVPLFLVMASSYLVYHRKIGFRSLLGSWAVFVLLAVPIGLFVLVNLLKLPSLDLGLCTVPHLTSPARFVVTTSLFGGGAIGQFGHNLARCWQLLVTQQDPRLFNQIPGFGYAYPFHWPVTLLGLGLMLGQCRRYHPGALVVAWLLAGLSLGLCYTDPNINRLNILFLPLHFFTAVGLSQLVTWAGRSSPRLGRAVLSSWLVLYLVFLWRFSQAYFIRFPAQIGPIFFEGLGEAIQFAEKHAPASICLTGSINMPYIFVLFYTRTDPRLFQSTVRWANPGEMWLRAATFGRYSFGQENFSGAAQATYIWRRDELLGRLRPGQRVRIFSNYVVVLPALFDRGNGGPSLL